jgi:hypothetical protein
MIPNFIVLCWEVETMDAYLARVALLNLLAREISTAQESFNPSLFEVENKQA